MRLSGSIDALGAVVGSLVLLVGSLPAVASQLTGIPPLAHHFPDLEVYPQNFALTQDSTGLIYIGNYDGVLTFDGERWAMIPTAGRDVVRSLAYDGGSRVYVGGYGEFGMLERSVGGVLSYTDLTPVFAEILDGETFADIWDTFVAPEGVYFRALNDIFLYDPRDGSARHWHHDGRFGAIATLDGHTVLQFRGEGFRRFVDGAWLPIEGTASLSELVYALIPAPDGGLLTLGRQGDWQLLSSTGVTAYPMPEAMPPSSKFQSGRFATDGSLLLGSDDGDMTVVRSGDQRVQTFKVGDGFLQNIMPAAGGGLITVDYYGVHHIDWPSHWTRLGQELGLAGSIHDLARWRGDWYAMTGGGVSALDVDPATGTERFQPRDWTEHEAWALLEVGADEALLADSYSVHVVTSGGVGPALTHLAFYPRVLQRSADDPDVVFVGTELGIGVLQRCGTTWCLTLDRDDMDELRVVEFVQLGSHELLLSSDRGGIRRVRFDEEFTELLLDEVQGADQGLDYADYPTGRLVELADGRILATTAAGVYEYLDGRFEATDLEGLAAISAAEGGVNISNGADGTLWAWSWNHIYRRTADDGWVQEDISAIRRGSLDSALMLEDGSALFPFSGDVLLYTPDVPVDGDADAPELSVALRRVTRIGEGEQRVALERASDLALDEGEFSLMFEFALADMRNVSGTRYQARMTGYEEEFSDYSRITRITYSHLEPGEYRFDVRARASDGRISEIEPFLFRVVPPWYRSLPALIAFWSLAALVVALMTRTIIRRRTRRLSGERDRLESMVMARTSELETANRRLETMAHLDGLTGIPNRRRLDDYMEQVWAQSAERDRSVSVLIIDVDHFKAFNDKHGHLAGDTLLKSLVTRLGHCLRRTEDLLARYGGEEFIVVLPGADTRVAEELAEQMREQVEESSLGATISIGVATRDPSRTGRSDDLIAAADTALYAAKEAGRNCVRVSGRS